MKDAGYNQTTVLAKEVVECKPVAKYDPMFDQILTLVTLSVAKKYGRGKSLLEFLCLYDLETTNTAALHYPSIRATHPERDIWGSPCKYGL